MNAALLRGLLTARLLQFGTFQAGGADRPFLASLDLLASYPELLRACADAFVLHGEQRLLAAPDALPLAVLIGQRLDLPVIYSRGTGAPGTIADLIGAYDIGHRTALITAVIDPAAGLDALADGAGRVGLSVEHVYGVLSVPTRLAQPQTALFRLEELLVPLTAWGELPPGQAEAVRRWLENNGQPV